MRNIKEENCIVAIKVKIKKGKKKDKSRKKFVNTRELL